MTIHIPDALIHIVTAGWALATLMCMANEIGKSNMSVWTKVGITMLGSAGVFAAVVLVARWTA